MKKALLALGIITLFIGMSVFAGATSIDTDTIQQKSSSTTYPFARIELGGKLEITNGFGWPVPLIYLWAFLDILFDTNAAFFLSTSESLKVLEGTLTVKPLLRPSVTLYSGDTINTKVMYGFGVEDGDPNTSIILSLRAIAIGVTIE